MLAPGYANLSIQALLPASGSAPPHLVCALTLMYFHIVVSAQIAKMYYGQMGAEGNMQGFVDALQGEKMLPGYASLRQIAGIPNFLRPPLSWMLRNVLGDERKASILG